MGDSLCPFLVDMTQNMDVVVECPGGAEDPLLDLVVELVLADCIAVLVKGHQDKMVVKVIALPQTPEGWLLCLDVGDD